MSAASPWKGRSPDMAKELAPIDISHVPELLRVAEDVRATNTPRVLRRNDEDIAMVVPLAPRSSAIRPASSNVAKALAAGYQAVPRLPQSLSVEEMVQIAS